MSLPLLMLSKHQVLGCKAYGLGVRVPKICGRSTGFWGNIYVYRCGHSICFL